MNESQEVCQGPNGPIVLCCWYSVYVLIDEGCKRLVTARGPHVVVSCPKQFFHVSFARAAHMRDDCVTGHISRLNTGAGRGGGLGGGFHTNHKLPQNRQLDQGTD